ncbi:MAG: hypothetical protein ACR2QI_03570 [Woeseiaceae bacterium]
MFKNKHVVVAMLVAPVLSIMAWFAVDYFIGERPHAAKSGTSYLLIAKSNCRYDSGQCDLANGDFELTLRPTEIGATIVELHLASKFPLQSATAGLINDGEPNTPTKMISSGTGATEWSATLARPASGEGTIRIAVVAQGATYYAEVPTVFLSVSASGRLR